MYNSQKPNPKKLLNIKDHISHDNPKSSHVKIINNKKIFNIFSIFKNKKEEIKDKNLMKSLETAIIKNPQDIEHKKNNLKFSFLNIFRKKKQEKNIDKKPKTKFFDIFKKKKD